MLLGHLLLYLLVVLVDSRWVSLVVLKVKELSEGRLGYLGALLVVKRSVSHAQSRLRLVVAPAVVVIGGVVIVGVLEHGHGDIVHGVCCLLGSLLKYYFKLPSQRYGSQLFKIEC